MKLVRALGVAALLALNACATSQETSSADASIAIIAEGHRIAQHNCAGCHAIGTFGQSPNPMAPPFRRLSQAYPINSLDEAFAEGVVVGHSDMPHFRMTVGQIDALTAYMRSIQPHPPPQSGE